MAAARAEGHPSAPPTVGVYKALTAAKLGASLAATAPEGRSALSQPPPSARTRAIAANTWRVLLQRVTELRRTEQRQILNALKYLSNRLSVSIAGFGSGEARVLIETDLHLAERFDIVALSPWDKAAHWAVDAVIAGISRMPLRKPTKVDRHLMAALFRNSDRLIGRMFRLLERAGIAALDNEECLSATLIEDVAHRRRRAENG